MCYVTTRLGRAEPSQTELSPSHTALHSTSRRIDGEEEEERGEEPQRLSPPPPSSALPISHEHDLTLSHSIGGAEFERAAHCCWSYTPHHPAAPPTPHLLYMRDGVRQCSLIWKPFAGGHAALLPAPASLPSHHSCCLRPGTRAGGRGMPLHFSLLQT